MRACVSFLAVVGAVLAVGSANAATGECAGIPTCIDVPGPWVAVPAQGEAKFLLDCPQRRGVVGRTNEGQLRHQRAARGTFRLPGGLVSRHRRAADVRMITTHTIMTTVHVVLTYPCR